MLATLRVSRVGSTTQESLPKITYTTLTSTAIPMEIFVYQVDDRGIESDKYIGVSSLQELESLPNARSSVAKGNFYRRPSATIKFTTYTAANKGNKEIEYAIKDLVEAYNKSSDIINLDDVLEV